MSDPANLMAFYDTHFPCRVVYTESKPKLAIKYKCEEIVRGHIS